MNGEERMKQWQKYFGSQPVMYEGCGSALVYWHIVQLVEHLAVNQGVGSSSLSVPAKLNSVLTGEYKAEAIYFFIWQVNP